MSWLRTFREPVYFYIAVLVRLGIRATMDAGQGMEHHAGRLFSHDTTYEIHAMHTEQHAEDVLAKPRTSPYIS